MMEIHLAHPKVGKRQDYHWKGFLLSKRTVDHCYTSQIYLIFKKIALSKFVEKFRCETEPFSKCAPLLPPIQPLL